MTSTSANTFTDLTAGTRLWLANACWNSGITSNAFTDCVYSLDLTNLGVGTVPVVYPQCNTFLRTAAGNQNYYTSYGIRFRGDFVFDKYDQWVLPNNTGKGITPLKNYFRNEHPYPSTFVWLSGNQHNSTVPSYATYDGVTSDPTLMYSPIQAINPATQINFQADVQARSFGVSVAAGRGAITNSKYDDGQSCSYGAGIYAPRPAGGTSAVVTDELGPVHPNPVSEQATISYRLPADLPGAELVVREVQSGKVVRRLPLAGGQGDLMLDVTNLRAGVYTYQVEGGNVVLPARRLLINH